MYQVLTKLWRHTLGRCLGHLGVGKTSGKYCRASLIRPILEEYSRKSVGHSTSGKFLYYHSLEIRNNT